MSENDQILIWRRDYAVKLGFPMIESANIAAQALDLHEIEKLIEKGCAPALALEIVA